TGVSNQYRAYEANIRDLVDRNAGLVKFDKPISSWSCIDLEKANKKLEQENIGMRNEYPAKIKDLQGHIKKFQQQLEDMKKVLPISMVIIINISSKGKGIFNSRKTR